MGFLPHVVCRVPVSGGQSVGREPICTSRSPSAIVFCLISCGDSVPGVVRFLCVVSCGCGRFHRARHQATGAQRQHGRPRETRRPQPQDATRGARDQRAAAIPHRRSNRRTSRTRTYGSYILVPFQQRAQATRKRSRGWEATREAGSAARLVRAEDLRCVRRSGYGAGTSFSTSLASSWGECSRYSESRGVSPV